MLKQIGFGNRNLESHNDVKVYNSMQLRPKAHQSSSVLKRSRGRAFTTTKKGTPQNFHLVLLKCLILFLMHNIYN